ncbi:TIM-barrel domain-containing protein [Saccharibacillus sp. JS10]|uniref:glycoside hydrolase family 31 protein n=1 Tax=Saccharibacillus sp. JS10 TaxID=2950552 RepID=UPI00210942A3|nr:TIM-barrel domain-containing protein [Saccharibacillus sp. JS10]MCQ4087375.1 glycoside hydrolase family 31 protein [Saccharibacillus sp. JS10]
MDTSEAIHPDRIGAEVVRQAWGQIGKALSLTCIDGVYICRGERASLAFVFLSDTMFRMKLFMGKDVDLSSTIAVLPREQSKLEATLQESESAWTLSSGQLVLEIEKKTSALSIFDVNERLVARQDQISWNPRGAIQAVYDMPGDSHFYGLGEKASFLDKKGEHYTMWNTDVYAPHVPEIEALYQSIPLLIHMHGRSSYGIFLDNPGRTDFDMRSHGIAYTIGCSTGDYDIYFVYGPQLKDVVREYTKLTGRIALPPKWALGYHQSRYSYMDQNEVLNLARTFREKEIPCDVIYLDIHYMDEYRVFTFDPVRFPDPEGMMAELKSLGIRIVPIVDPGVKKDPKYEVYRQGIANNHFSRKLEGDLFFGDVWPGISAFPDFTDDSASEWWGNLHKYYTELGIAGIWNDMNEPAVFNASKTMDLDVMHSNNGNPKTHEELHNLYGMLMSKATYEGLKNNLDGERPFVLTRAGYSGIQRYAAVWTGDNRSFWEHMALAMPMVLNMGLSGLAFAGPDIGGFAHHTSAELLVRWTQMGVLFPYCRNHSAIATLRQEPWSFGPEIESILREYIGLRYRWMPHLYNLFQEASETGLPPMRPLLLEYQDDPNVTNLCDQFLVGRDVLAAPIYRPDTEHRAVYLPEGEWIDYWTGEVIAGNRHILAHAPLRIMPLYIKSGAVIAEGVPTLYADDRTDETITLRIYGAQAKKGFKASYSLYEDDSSSFAYEQGASSLLQFELIGEDHGLQLQYRYERQGYQANREFLRFTLVCTSFKLAQIEGLNELTIEEAEEGQEGWYFDEQTGGFTLQVQDRSEGATYFLKG